MLPLLGVAGATVVDERPVVRVGVLAKRGADLARSRWGETARYLSESIPRYRFEIVPLGFDEILPAVDRHEIEFVLTNSAYYVVLETRFRAFRIATLRNLRQGHPYELFGGVILRRADREDIATLNDLEGRRFMAVDASSLGGFLAAWRELKHAGIDPYRNFSALEFGGTHDAVVYAVRDGRVDAGTVRTDTLERMAGEGRIDLADFEVINPRGEGQHFRFPFLISTELYPEWPFTALVHTPADLTAEVALALLRMPADSPAARSSKAGGWAVPANYQPVRDLLQDLRLPPYQDLGKVTLRGLIEDQWPLVLAVFVGLLAALGISAYLARLNKRLAVSGADLQHARDHLETRVAERTAELEREVEERRLAEERLRRQEEHMAYLASHDALTQLPNRLLFNDRLELAMRRARRNQKRLALLFFDLDRFKTINDSLGHAVGDRLLEEVADRLCATVRGSDSIARLGGDEFVVLIESVDSAEQAAVVARKIQAAIAVPIRMEGFEIRVGLSMGISIFPEDAGDRVGLLKCADTAMYRAKDEGRDQFQFYTADMNVRAVERMAMESALRQALKAGELELHYQPQLDLATRGLRGAECLLRWRHPSRGLMSPGEFIPLAEETGLIVPLGEWVLVSALRQARAWRDAGLGDLPLAVNLSARQFWHQDLERLVSSCLSDLGVDPKHLELELTESVMMQDVDAAVDAIAGLKGLGVGVAIDDFGTGNSSLSYLQRFPVDTLKIDKSFIGELAPDGDAAAIVSAVVALSRRMGLRTVAEGVEHWGQVDVLVREGCDIAQGFLFGRPMPSVVFQSVLENHGSRSV